MVLDIYFIRHGETEYNITNEIIGGQSIPLELSERGIEQAKALGKRLKKEGVKFDKVFSSTAVRAKHTAEIVCEIIGFQKDNIIETSELLEINQGEWEDKIREETHTPDILKEMQEKHWDFKAPGGESQREVEARAFDWIEKNLLNKETSETIGIFGHGITTKCIFRRILDSKPELTYRIILNNCSISRLKYVFSGHHEGWSVMKINDDSHLEEIGRVQASHV